MFLLDGGIFLVQAEQTFRPPVQSVRSLYCYQLLSLRHIHSPFAPRLFSESSKDMALQVFQQNNPLTATCHSNAPVQWALAQLSGKEWGGEGETLPWPK